MLTGEALFVLVYFAATPMGPHRPALLAVSALTFILAVCALLFVDRVSAMPWRVTFSLLSTLFSGAVLTVVICLDGGLDSALVVLIALPVLSAALALPIRGVWICGVAALVEFAIVMLANLHVAVSRSQIAATSAFLVGVVVLSLGAAVYRARLEHDEERLKLELHHQARVDTLTGCLSYGVFYDELSIEVDRALRHGHALSLLIIDIDLFKSFNDARGHVAGDAALVRAGALIRQTSRSIDAVARIGGDEFAVILPMTDLTSARTLAERIVTAFAESVEGEIRVSVSVGYATLDPLEPTSQKLFRDADRGLYLAKAHGRGRSATITDVDAVIAPHRGRNQEARGPGDRTSRLDPPRREPS